MSEFKLGDSDCLAILAGAKIQVVARKNNESSQKCREAFHRKLREMDVSFYDSMLSGNGSLEPKLSKIRENADFYINLLSDEVLKLRTHTKNEKEALAKDLERLDAKRSQLSRQLASLEVERFILSYKAGLASRDGSQKIPNEGSKENKKDERKLLDGIYWAIGG